MKKTANIKKVAGRVMLKCPLCDFTVQKDDAKGMIIHIKGHTDKEAVAL
ncbi:hypothetical protein JXB01_00870 [Candidatus Micrarchaeota archaeon]|nr:hypothetical protein [Candidatus Micrarchaeota archaeon]